MDVAHDFQNAESNQQRAGGEPGDAAPIFKKLDERFEEVSACIAKALELEAPEEDPAIFSDGSMYQDRQQGNEKMLEELQTFKRQIELMTMRSRISSMGLQFPNRENHEARQASASQG